MRHHLAVLACALAVLIAGCGSDDGDAAKPAGGGKAELETS